MEIECRSEPPVNRSATGMEIDGVSLVTCLPEER